MGIELKGTRGQILTEQREYTRTHAHAHILVLTTTLSNLGRHVVLFDHTMSRARRRGDDGRPLVLPSLFARSRSLRVTRSVFGGQLGKPRRVAITTECKNGERYRFCTSERATNDERLRKWSCARFNRVWKFVLWEFECC